MKSPALKKKLIEVALPLRAINTESLRRKQKAPKGWPTSFHKWWAQRPLAAARAVIFAQMVDDPSANPDLFPTVKKQEKERARLMGIIEDLVLWDNTNNQSILQAARNELWQTWRRACAEYSGHPDAQTLFDRNSLPAFLDPFAGSGSLPLTAQWLGLTTYARDLNPVAVLVNKAMIEIPPRFSDRPAVNPAAQRQRAQLGRVWRGAQGLGEDVRHYAEWMRDEATRRIGHMYPEVEVTSQMAAGREDLEPLVGKRLAPVAWLWVRTVKSPDPAYAGVAVPLATTFMLSTKAGKEVFVQPFVEGNGYRFTVRLGKPKDPATGNGTKSGGSHSTFKCLMSATPIPFEYIREEAKAGRMGERLMAIVVEGPRGRVFLSPPVGADGIPPETRPEGELATALPEKALGFRVQEYGMKEWGDLFTARQLRGLVAFSDLAQEARRRVLEDALAAGLANDSTPLAADGTGAAAYADAICTYLACVVDRMAYYGSSLTTWLAKDNALRDCMPRQALAMTWDFAEGNPLGKSSGDVLSCAKSVSSYLDSATPFAPAFATQGDAQQAFQANQGLVISTDPPYYDNVSYADLSDFFYVWLRRTLRPVFPDLFGTLTAPKSAELVATPYRHGGVESAKVFFLKGMTEAMQRLAAQAHPAYPVTIYYAFKQTESDSEDGTSSTGWETFLDSVIRAGFAISGTWPMRTEGEGRMRNRDSNALGSSILLVCRPRPAESPAATRGEFVSALRTELPPALAHLQSGIVAPVDLAQSAIGPGMAVFTRYSKILDADGQPLSVHDALVLINETLEAALAEQEGEFDSDTRWAITWFDEVGFGDGEFGVAEQLSKSKNTSVKGLVQAGIVASRAGKVRLLRPSELPADWDPRGDRRLTIWEVVHQLIRALELQGEAGAARLVSLLGAAAEPARDLAYRLFNLCTLRRRATEAMSYNSLGQSWAEIGRLAREASKPTAPAQKSFGDDEE